MGLLKAAIGLTAWYLAVAILVSLAIGIVQLAGCTSVRLTHIGGPAKCNTLAIEGILHYEKCDADDQLEPEPDEVKK